MQKKGVVYRATMSMGFLFLFGITFGEVAYWKYFKQERDEEIAEERHAEAKEQRWSSVGIKLEEEGDVATRVEGA